MQNDTLIAVDLAKSVFERLASHARGLPARRVHALVRPLAEAGGCRGFFTYGGSASIQGCLNSLHTFADLDALVVLSRAAKRRRLE